MAAVDLLWSGGLFLRQAPVRVSHCFCGLVAGGGARGWGDRRRCSVARSWAVVRTGVARLACFERVSFASAVVLLMG